MQDITKWRLHDVTFFNYKYCESEDFNHKFAVGVDWFKGEDPWSSMHPERNKHRRKTFDFVIFFYKWYVRLELKGEVVGEIYHGRKVRSNWQYLYQRDQRRKHGKRT